MISPASGSCLLNLNLAWCLFFVGREWLLNFLFSFCNHYSLPQELRLASCMHVSWHPVCRRSSVCSFCLLHQWFQNMRYLRQSIWAILPIPCPISRWLSWIWNSSIFSIFLTLNTLIAVAVLTSSPPGMFLVSCLEHVVSRRILLGIFLSVFSFKFANWLLLNSLPRFIYWFCLLCHLLLVYPAYSIQPSLPMKCHKDHMHMTSYGFSLIEELQHTSHCCPYSIKQRQKCHPG